MYNNAKNIIKKNRLVFHIFGIYYSSKHNVKLSERVLNCNIPLSVGRLSQVYTFYTFSTHLLSKKVLAYL